MKKAVLRNAALPTLLAGGFILLDLVLDRYLGSFDRLDWPHLILATSILLISFILLSRAVGAHDSAEDVLRRARDEMESRVRARTAELEQANEALRTEVAERKRIEQALRTSEETAQALLNASSESAMLLDAQGIIYPVSEADGNIVRLAAFGQDITERKQAEQALRDSETLLRTIAENYPDSYLSIIEKDLTIGFTSGQQFKKQNLNPDQFVGMTLEQVFGNHAAVVCGYYSKTFAGQEQSFELFLNNQHQSYRW